MKSRRQERARRDEKGRELDHIEFTAMEDRTGRHRAAVATLTANVLHWKELGLARPAAALAEQLDRPELAAVLLEAHGDMRGEPLHGELGRISSYNKAAYLYAEQDNMDAVDRVLTKLDKLSLDQTPVTRGGNPFRKLLAAIARP